MAAAARGSTQRRPRQEKFAGAATPYNAARTRMGRWLRAYKTRQPQITSMYYTCKMCGNAMAVERSRFCSQLCRDAAKRQENKRKEEYRKARLSADPEYRAAYRKRKRKRSYERQRIRYQI